MNTGYQRGWGTALRPRRPRGDDTRRVLIADPRGGRDGLDLAANLQRQANYPTAQASTGTTAAVAPVLPIRGPILAGEVWTWTLGGLLNNTPGSFGQLFNTTVGTQAIAAGASQRPYYIRSRWVFSDAYPGAPSNGLQIAYHSIFSLGSTAGTNPAPLSATTNERIVVVGGAANGAAIGTSYGVVTSPDEWLGLVVEITWPVSNINLSATIGQFSVQRQRGAYLL